MSIATRTSEGLPFRCKICGEVTLLEPSLPLGDAVCPRCGNLVVWFRDRIGANLGIDAEAIPLDASFLHDLHADSLDIVELVMELEEEFGFVLPDDEAEHMQTLADVIRWYLRRQEKPPE